VKSFLCVYVFNHANQALHFGLCSISKLATCSSGCLWHQLWLRKIARPNAVACPRCCCPFFHRCCCAAAPRCRHQAQQKPHVATLSWRRDGFMVHSSLWSSICVAADCVGGEICFYLRLSCTCPPPEPSSFCFPLYFLMHWIFLANSKVPF